MSYRARNIFKTFWNRCSCLTYSFNIIYIQTLKILRRNIVPLKFFVICKKWLVSKSKLFCFLFFPLRFSSLTFSGGTLSSHIINSHIVWEKQGKSQKGHNTNNNWSNVRKRVIRGFIGGLI